MKKLLIVDDSSSMRQMVAFTLKSAGFETDEACDGSEALNKANSQKYDGVITDINMPNMNGVELVTELRAMPDYKFTPILLLTTESSADKKGEGKKAGATGWIIKPFNPETLVRTVQKTVK